MVVVIRDFELVRNSDLECECTCCCHEGYVPPLEPYDKNRWFVWTEPNAASTQYVIKWAAIVITLPGGESEWPEWPQDTLVRMLERLELSIGGGTVVTYTPRDFEEDCPRPVCGKITIPIDILSNFPRNLAFNHKIRFNLVLKDEGFGPKVLGVPIFQLEMDKSSFLGTVGKKDIMMRDSYYLPIMEKPEGVVETQYDISDLANEHIMNMRIEGVRDAWITRDGKHIDRTFEYGELTIHYIADVNVTGIPLGVTDTPWRNVIWRLAYKADSKVLLHLKTPMAASEIKMSFETPNILRIIGGLAGKVYAPPKTKIHLHDQIYGGVFERFTNIFS